jgi:hypothetical protein
MPLPTTTNKIAKQRKKFDNKKKPKKKAAAPKLPSKKVARIPDREALTELIANLTPHPKNYRGHSADQIEHIKTSIRTNGVYRNVIIAKDNVILGGHGVVQAATEMGLAEIKVIRLPWGSNDPRSLKVLTGDNEISRLAGVDDRQLTNLLKEIKDAEGFDLQGTGFDEQMLAALVMVTRTSDEISDFNAAAEWTGMPDFAPGDEAYRLIVQFRNADDRVKFLKQANIDPETLKAREAKSGKVWSVWWPSKERNDLASVRFEQDTSDDEEVNA